MCHYQSIRHARCGHDSTKRTDACALGHHHHCHQRYDLGMRQDASLCRNCQRRVAQMGRHGTNSLASMSAEIRRARFTRSGSVESLASNGSTSSF